MPTTFVRWPRLKGDAAPTMWRPLTPPPLLLHASTPRPASASHTPSHITLPPPPRLLSSAPPHATFLNPYTPIHSTPIHAVPPLSSHPRTAPSLHAPSPALSPPSPLHRTTPHASQSTPACFQGRTVGLEARLEPLRNMSATEARLRDDKKRDIRTL